MPALKAYTHQITYWLFAASHRKLNFSNDKHLEVPVWDHALGQDLYAYSVFIRGYYSSHFILFSVEFALYLQNKVFFSPYLSYLFSCNVSVNLYNGL